METLQLIEANPDPTKSAVMSRAAELVAEGYDRSDATSMAWDDIMAEDFGLPGAGEDEFDDDMDFFPMAKSKTNTNTRRRNSMDMDNPLATVGISSMLLLGGMGYLLWCAFQYSKTKQWSWTPWKTVPVARRLAAKTADAEHEVRLPSNNGWEQPITLIVP